VTFKNSHGVQAGLREARPELVMVETDAPFLTPHGSVLAVDLARGAIHPLAQLLEGRLEMLGDPARRLHRPTASTEPLGR
jgi:TatD DNase family protein